MNKLIIVESPNKISSIKKYVGDEYDVQASVGHIVYLPSTGEHRFGVDLKTWNLNYKIDPSKRKIVKNLKLASEKADEIFIATDPDREGEAIGDNLVHFLKIDKKYKRIRFNEITKEAIIRSLSDPTIIDENLVKSQIARRILDRIIGYQLSQLMGSKISNSPINPSAGRVQSIALKKVVEREKEIEKFVPIEYMTIKAKISDDVFAIINNGNFHNKKEWVDPKKIDDFKKNFQGNLKVNKIFIVKKKDPKKTPFKQSTLYKRADSFYGMSAASVQRAAQRLYEGYGDGGLISYPRTDSTRLSDVFVKNAKEYIKSNWSEDLVSKNIKGTSGKQDAHEAIRPTDPSLTPDQAKLKFNLSNPEAKIYELIYNNTLMALMTSPIREIIRYELIENDAIFKMSSSRVIFEGYLKLVKYEKSKELPIFKENEIISVQDYIIEKGSTKPPARYNDGSLIELLDSIGVGRPSTFATTVNILKNRLYVELEGRAMKATKFGKVVFEKLISAFPKIINEEYTANMEKQLDDISEKKEDYKKLLDNFWSYFKKEVENASQNLPLTKLPLILAGKKCPKCEADLVVRINKKDLSKFFACSNFPKCRHTESDPNQKNKKFFKKKVK